MQQTLSTTDPRSGFEPFFRALWDRDPFSWQTDLAQRVLERAEHAPGTPTEEGRSPWPEPTGGPVPAPGPSTRASRATTASSFSTKLSERLDVPYDTTVVQTNVVGHTGADGYSRLARQAAFGGNVERERRYVMVDDFIGQGGTLANLRGWVEKQGGLVVGAVGLTGKAYSVRLNPSEERLHELREKHGPDFEKWWKEHFGHAFDCLTHSEARYLAHSPDVDTIRSRLAAAMREGGGPGDARSPREQRLHVRELTALLQERFPAGQPRMRRRPGPGKWQGYGPLHTAAAHSAPRSVFDPRVVVIGLAGPRPTLPVTLKLSAALRGLLMRECPQQPPPEWLSGHRGDGTPASDPHLALAPLPFVGAPQTAASSAWRWCFRTD